MTIEEARARGEAIAHGKLDEETFEEILRYSYRKARLTGHGPEYVPLLLVDEIKDHFYRLRMNQVSTDYQELMKEISREGKRGKHSRPFLNEERKASIRNYLGIMAVEAASIALLAIVWLNS